MLDSLAIRLGVVQALIGVGGKVWRSNMATSLAIVTIFAIGFPIASNSSLPVALGCVGLMLVGFVASITRYESYITRTRRTYERLTQGDDWDA